MEKDKIKKILEIRDYNLKKEFKFPQNAGNITKDELHEHFDLDNDGRVTLGEYAEHIKYHCDNPETLDEELEQSEYEKGFLYAKGGSTKSSNTEVAETIIKQLGGIGKLKAFTGANSFGTNGKNVTFRIKNRKVNAITINLNGKDLYDIKFFRIRGADMKLIKEYNDIYNDQLIPIFEENTGMYLSFSKGGKLDYNKRFKKGGKTKEAKTWKEKYNKKYGNDLDKPNSLSKISEDTGVSKKGLQQIFNKGVGAYKTNPSSVRPNVKSPEQWAQARVYSAVMGGKAAKVDKKELSMEKGGIMDSRRDKDKEFDRAQEREYMKSQYGRLTQDDKEKLRMIQQMMAKEKVNYAKGGDINMSPKLDYLYNQLKISKEILDNSFNQSEKNISLLRYDSIQKVINDLLVNPNI